MIGTALALYRHLNGLALSGGIKDQIDWEFGISHVPSHKHLHLRNIGVQWNKHGMLQPLKKKP
jgi:hypothetical protein